MSLDMIIFTIIMVTVIGIVIWDMYKDKEDEPRE
jgi:hypothetical protein